MSNGNPQYFLKFIVITVLVYVGFLGFNTQIQITCNTKCETTFVFNKAITNQPSLIKEASAEPMIKTTAQKDNVVPLNTYDPSLVKSLPALPISKLKPNTNKSVK